MTTKAADEVVTVSLTDLEELVRRIIREELTRVLPRQESILDDWSQEGPDDPEGDEELLQEVLALREEYKRDKSGWKTWDVFEVELDRAEAAGELPN